MYQKLKNENIKELKKYGDEADHASLTQFSTTVRC